MSSWQEMFLAACAYHGALAAYSRAMRFGEDVEDAAQQVIGTSLRYRLALDRLIAEEPKNSDCRRRAEALRRLLHSVSAKYNLSKLPSRRQRERDRRARERHAAESAA